MQALHAEQRMRFAVPQLECMCLDESVVEACCRRVPLWLQADEHEVTCQCGSRNEDHDYVCRQLYGLLSLAVHAA